MKQLLIVLTLLIAFGANAVAQKKVSAKKLTKTLKGDWTLQSPEGETSHTQVFTFESNGALNMVTEMGTATGKWKVLEDGKVLFYDNSQTAIADQEMDIKIVNKHELIMTAKRGEQERSVTLIRKEKPKKGK